MPDSADINTIGTDYHLCLANALAAVQWMKERATIYSLGQGKAKRYFFRLSGDQREVNEFWTKKETIG